MQFNINSGINKIVDFAPVVLFVMLFVTLFLTGYLQSNFYSSVFTDLLPTEYIAVLLPIVLQVLRLVTGFLSASFFKKRRFVAGSIVFLFSIWLTMFEHNEAKVMGTYWMDTGIDLSVVTHTETMVTISKDIITNVMHLLIWSALFLEFFLAVWLSFSPATSLVTKDGEVIFSSDGQEEAAQN